MMMPRSPTRLNVLEVAKRKAPASSIAGGIVPLPAIMCGSKKKKVFGEADLRRTARGEQLDVISQIGVSGLSMMACHVPGSRDPLS